MTTHLANWSMQEVILFSCFVLLLTSFLLYSANRVSPHGAGSARAGVGPVLCLLGVFFIIYGSKLELINAFGSEVPFWDPWGQEGYLFTLVLEGRLDPSLLFQTAGGGAHVPLLSRLLAVTLLKLNGQWDPIVETVVNSLIYSLVLGGLCLVLWRLAGRKNLSIFCVIIAIGGVLHFGWENTVSTFQSCFYFLLGFSLLAIVMLVCSKTFGIPWFLGLAAALLGQLSLGTGFFAPFAVACVLVIDCVSGAQKLKQSAPAIVALLAAAISIFVLVPSHHALIQSAGPSGFFAFCARSIVFLKNFAKIAAWPFHRWAYAAVLWLPFFILIWKQFRAKRTSTFAQFLLALGIWALLHAAAIVWSRTSTGFEFAPRYKDILIVGVWINVIIAFCLLREHVPLFNRPSSYRVAIVVGTVILVFCTAVSVLHLNTSDIWTQYYRDVEEVNTARYILTGDPLSLTKQPRFHVPFPEGEILIPILDSQTLRKVLPTCIRAPLPLVPAVSSGFDAGRIPPGLPALTHRIVLGSWRADKGPSGSEYLSQPVSSSFQWLVFDVAGGGAGISFEILPSKGRAREIDVEEQTGMWKKIKVKVPREPFRVHVTDRSEQGFIAFSLPRELAAGGYYIRRLLSGSLLVIACGMMSLLAGFFVMSKENLLLRDSENPILP